MTKQEHTIIIGAGPCGIAAAIELQRVGIKPLIIEKKNIVHSISQYPTYMTFFSSPENLEIGDIPFTTVGEKPTRIEALNYYRIAAQRHNVRIQAYTTVKEMNKVENGLFSLLTINEYGQEDIYYTQHVIIATGYFDQPNMLNIPGEQLPKVTHFFREAHPYAGQKVAIIGGSNSAIDAALELERVGAHVTVIYRKSTYASNIKPWVLPTFEAKVKQHKINMMFNASVKEIQPKSITIAINDENDHEQVELENDFVLALTGFSPNQPFLTHIGITIEDEGHPTFNEETMESNVEGIYLAGVIVSRRENANEIFIESGRFHGHKIAAHLKQKYHL